MKGTGDRPLFFGLTYRECRMSRLFADLVLKSGKIAIGDAPYRFASALAARGGEIVALGSDADVEPLIGPETEVVDLAGRTAIPGIVKAIIIRTPMPRAYRRGSC